MNAATKQTEQRLRGVIYARYSSEKQREESIVGQIRDCEAFAKHENIDIVGIYKDEAMSARTDNRPSFQKMIRDSVHGTFDCIIVWKGDRFSRNRGDAANYKALLRKRGVRVLYAMEPNVDGPEAVLFEGINEAYAEFYSAELAVKITRGMRENVISGKWNGGHVPLGFEVKDSRLVIKEDEAEIVRLIFNLYDQGVTVSSIVKKLNGMGIKTRKGGDFKHISVFHILKMEIYIGIRRMGDIVNPNTVEPIIDVDVFRRCQARLVANKRMRSKYRSNVPFLLSGKVFYSETGCRMNGDTATSLTGAKYYYYSSRNTTPEGMEICSIPKSTLEDAVAKCVEMVLKDKGRRSIFLKAMNKFVNEADPEIEITKKGIEGTSAKIARILDLVENGTDVPDVQNRLSELHKTRETQKQHLYELERDTELIGETDVEYFIDALSEINFNSGKSRAFLFDNLVRMVYALPNNEFIIFFKFRDVVGQNEPKFLSSSSVSFAPPNEIPDEHLVYMDKYTVGIYFETKWYRDTHEIKGSSKYKTMRELDPSLTD